MFGTPLMWRNPVASMQEGVLKNNWINCERLWHARFINNINASAKLNSRILLDTSAKWQSAEAMRSGKPYASLLINHKVVSSDRNCPHNVRMVLFRLAQSWWHYYVTTLWRLLGVCTGNLTFPAVFNYTRRPLQSFNTTPVLVWKRCWETVELSVIWYAIMFIAMYTWDTNMSQWNRNTIQNCEQKIYL